LEDNLHRNRAVAVLLDAPLADVEALFQRQPPWLLCGLWMCRLQPERTLRDVFALTDEFVTLLETPFRSHDALLAGILEPEQDLDLLDDGTTPIGYLYEVMPSTIAECYERTVLNRPLLHQHIHHLVEWFTGGLSIPAEACCPLDSRLTFEFIRDAIKRSALACCTEKRPLDAHATFEGTCTPRQAM
jgi:hypothetical protein